MTRKFLIMGEAKPDASREAMDRLMVEEIRTVWRAHQTGLLREIYHRADKSGVVIILEAEDLEHAESFVKSLPLDEAGFLTTKVIELRPFELWSVLFGEHAR